MLMLRQSPITDISCDITNAKTKSISIHTNNKPRLQKIINDVIHYECRGGCCSFYKKEMFYQNHSYCKDCYNLQTKSYVNTIRGRLNFLITSAKKHSVKRSTKKSFRTDHDCDVQLEFILELLQKQNGRCAYSNVPFEYITDSDWKISLERKNPFLGYIENNVLLVCHEFNGSDYRTMLTETESDNKGGGFWNKNKFLFFLDHVEKT